MSASSKSHYQSLTEIYLVQAFHCEEGVNMMVEMEWPDQLVEVARTAHMVQKERGEIPVWHGPGPPGPSTWRASLHTLDIPPVPMCQECSWSIKEELGRQDMLKEEEEITNACQMTPSTRHIVLEYKATCTCTALSMSFHLRAVHTMTMFPVLFATSQPEERC